MLFKWYGNLTNNSLFVGTDLLNWGHIGPHLQPRRLATWVNSRFIINYELKNIIKSLKIIFEIYWFKGPNGSKSERSITSSPIHQSTTSTTWICEKLNVFVLYYLHEVVK
jgi:hypothetical protein